MWREYKITAKAIGMYFIQLYENLLFNYVAKKFIHINDKNLFSGRCMSCEKHNFIQLCGKRFYSLC